MHYFFWYDDRGAIRGVTQCRDTIDPNCEPDNPNTTHPQGVDLRRFYFDGQGAAFNVKNCVRAECGCSPISDCQCGSACVRNKVVVSGRLVDKPVLTVYIDGEAQSAVFGVMVNKAPGSKVSIRLEAPDVPEGHQIVLSRGGAELSIEDELVFTFSGGSTNTIVLTAPAQGLMGAIAASSISVRDFSVTIRGWA